MQAKRRRFAARLTLRTEIIFLIAAFGLLPTIFLGIFSYGWLTAQLEERLFIYSVETVRQATDSVDALFRQAEAARTQVILKANTSQRLLRGTPMTPAEHALAVRDLTEFLQNARLAFRMLFNIYIVAADESVYSSSIIVDTEKLLEKPWVQDLLDPANPRELFHLHRADYEWTRGTHSYVLSTAMRVTSAENPEDVIRIIVDIDSEALTTALRAVNIEKSGEVLLLDQRGMILASGRLDHLDRDVREVFGSCVFTPESGDIVSTRTCDGRIVVLQEVGAIGYVLAVVPLAEFLDDVTDVRNLFIFLSLGFAALTIVLSIALAGRITRPISRLSRAMRQLQDGDFSVRVPERGTREIVTLAGSFNTMGAEIDTLLKKIALEEREILRAELLALRLQINPHFLYNTLEVMRGIAYARDVPETAEIASSLAALLRYSAAMDGETVPLQDEMGSLRHYLKIQKHRFGDRFTTRIQIEPEASGCMIPRFILQPLVENAFLHAIEKSTSRLLLQVRIYMENNDLLIEVQDNGQGMGEQELASLRHSLEQGMESQNTGIGLLNVHNRIRLGCGADYGVTISSGLREGTRVVLRLPLEFKTDEIL